MQTQELKDLWERFEFVRKELLTLLEGATDEDLTYVPAGFRNPAAVIARHLAGAELYWIGQVVGGRDAQRNRDAEFSRPLWSRAWLLEALSKSRDLSAEVFRELDGASLDGPPASPLPIKPPYAPDPLTRRWALLHLLEHEAYHLGQLSLLLRIARESGAQV